MERLRRNSVHVALHGTLGRDLVFRHYTNKVVVAHCPERTTNKLFNTRRQPGSKVTEANHYAQIIMCSPDLRALYEKYLRDGETVFQKAIKEYYEQQIPRRA